ncbi:hypothetical protein GE061_002285 [Apolygus lucorum]|uniref:Oxidation resistance protein 1 n=1 Tax=Apolygus lucorum TaxID=248454 RepID=A0A8S9X4Q2_APOLU|nr:hypothetical protein GE061_002285 [Apolygus lucorum]
METISELPLTLPDLNYQEETNINNNSIKFEPRVKILETEINDFVVFYYARDTDGESGSRESLVERKMQPSVPVKTTTYKVEATDTLTSVAARFDTTPSELCKLNRLAARTVFPGQVIRVPDKSAKKDKAEGDDDGDHVSQTTSTERSDNTDEEDMLETLRVNSPKPGHVERVGTPSSPHLEKFLRINVRHITDGQGVVSGVLIVTPNAFMFDPNVSDPLVIERGPESYGVIAPMDYVVNAAIYHDIAHMRVANAENKFNLPKPEVYHMKSEESEGEGDASVLLSTTDQGDSRDLSAKETLPDLRSSTEDDDALWFSGTQREGDAFPKAFERDLVTPTNSTIDKLSDTQDQDTTADDKSPLNDEEDTARVEEPSKAEDSSRVDPPDAMMRAAKERRESILDQHWAVPKHSIDQEREESIQEPEPRVFDEGRRDSEGHLVKLSCHDSGIDIRDPPPPAPTQRKTVYSDADILLAGDGEFLPPVPVVPLPPPTVEEEKKKQSVSFSLDDEPKTQDDDKQQETRKNKMFKRLSYPLSWVEGITGSEDKDSLPSSADSHPSHTPSSVFSISKVFSRRASVGNPSYTKPKLDYRSMVSVEDMPELFVPFDKLIPRPARSCEDPPLYLRLRMGKPKDRKIPKSSTIMSYGKKRMRPEYWFSVPRERVDELYKFLTSWVGHLYGDLDDDIIAARGYELIDSDTELFDADDGTADGRRSSDGEIDINIAKESWELLSMSGELRRTLYASSGTSLDLEAFIPELRGTTEILTEEHRKQLSRHLPARAEGYTWTLVFSTSQHGFSLNSLYRKMANIQSPILMVIEDTFNNVFGALTSCPLQISDHFYGTGESFLYRFAPDLKVYKWTGENTYHIKGDYEALCIGAGDGKFGLWLDGDLNVGRSESCSTYNNEPLSSNLNFTMKTLECWAFL